MTRGGVDCSSGDEGRLVITSLNSRENPSSNVGPNEQRFVDAFNTQIFAARPE